MCLSPQAATDAVSAAAQAVDPRSKLRKARNTAIIVLLAGVFLYEIPLHTAHDHTYPHSLSRSLCVFASLCPGMVWARRLHMPSKTTSYKGASKRPTLSLRTHERLPKCPLHGHGRSVTPLQQVLRLRVMLQVVLHKARADGGSDLAKL